MLRWATLVLAIGCVRIAHEAPPLPAEVEMGAPQTQPTLANVEEPSAQSSTIRRAALDAVLAKGPAAFLRGLEVRAALIAGRFQGWQLLSFFPGDPRYAGVDLLGGDVVLRVNGMAIERPDEFFKVWQSLGQTGELTVDYLRDGVARQLCFTVAP